MPVFLFLIIWMILELYVIILVGSKIGGLMTIALLILSAAVGIAIIRNKMASFQREMTAQSPNNAMNRSSQTQSVFAIISGFLLILPGFITDTFALALLVPVIRKTFGLLLIRIFKPDVIINKFSFDQRTHHVYENQENQTSQDKKDDDGILSGEFIEHKKKNNNK